MSRPQKDDTGRITAHRLEAVSPSRYAALKAWKAGRTCPLQLLWSCPPSLAPYPAAKLGDVAHRMMDRLPHGVCSEDTANRAWEEALVYTEAKLMESWVTHGLVPLQRTVRSYTLKKTRAIRSILRASSSRHAFAAGKGPLKSFREADLRSRDGLLRGRADLIEQRAGEWTLVDYKSGSIHEDDQNSEQQRIKDEYAMQLQLYAHLIREAKGIVITKAMLRTLDGREHEVAVDETSVWEAGSEARSLLHDFNNEMQRHDNPLAAAKPMALSWDRGVFGCAGCLFRSLCPTYLTCEKPYQPGERWPSDAWGEVTSLERMRGFMRIQIQNENRVLGPEGKARDTNITVSLRNSTDRHPGLSGIEIGDEIQIYDFVATRLGIVAEDGPRTSVYAGGAVRVISNA